MGNSSPAESFPVIRPLQYRDLDQLKQWKPECIDAGEGVAQEIICRQVEYLRRWYGPIKVMSWLPKPLQIPVLTFVAEQQGRVLGLIQVSPVNVGRSTWQVDHIAVYQDKTAAGLSSGYMDVGSRLLRYCFEAVWEARTWLIEVDVNNRLALGLYRFNGFQPLAQVTYWGISSEQLAHLAEREPDLPNLLPVNNADAHLLYQLDTASMPPLVRQVYDHQIQDFKPTLVSSLGQVFERWINRSETISAYVFENQRKAAIGYFKLAISRDVNQPHWANLTVHPAYTWLYPELMVQMARALQPCASSELRLASLDYQPEREEYLTQIQADPQSRALLMSRSVWHKVRETKPVSLEGLQLSDVLSGLQPAGKPVPNQIVWTREQREGRSETVGWQGEGLKPRRDIRRRGNADNAPDDSPSCP